MGIGNEDGTFFDDLSNHPHIEFIEAQTPNALKEALLKIKFPFKIITIYPKNLTHVAWLSLSKPIKKVKKLTKPKPLLKETGLRKD